MAAENNSTREPYQPTTPGGHHQMEIWRQVKNIVGASHHFDRLATELDQQDSDPVMMLTLALYAWLYEADDDDRNNALNNFCGWTRQQGEEVEFEAAMAQLYPDGDPSPPPVEIKNLLGGRRVFIS